jgi:DNA-binding NtrC family response regulator
MKKRWNILVIDDEEVMRESLAAWLTRDGYTVDTASCGEEGIRKSAERDYAIHFIDIKLTGIDGIQTMLEIKKYNPESSVIVVTGFPTITSAIRAIKLGAQEYLVKPFNPQDISLVVDRILKIKTLERENQALRKKLQRQYRFQDILSKNPRMHEIFQLIREIARIRSTVLIEGESGTGKELIARAIHFSGDRASKPFVGVPCAALTETLLESELFGYDKGAFTGAVTHRKGKFEIADGGTLFLDEIGDIHPKLQMDLLRVLQQRSFYRVGGSTEISVDARVIAATNVDLEDAVRQQKFREDLYYRLNVINIRIPPLRDRREDIPLLAQHFVEKVANEIGREALAIGNDAMKALLDWHWPGNVRELENAVERAFIACHTDTLSEKDFSFLRQLRPEVDATHDLNLRGIEKRAIEAAIRRTGGNIKRAAEILGIDRSTLYDRIKRHGIQTPG